MICSSDKDKSCTVVLSEVYDDTRLFPCNVLDGCARVWRHSFCLVVQGTRLLVHHVPSAPFLHLHPRGAL